MEMRFIPMIYLGCQANGSFMIPEEYQKNVAIKGEKHNVQKFNWFGHIFMLMDKNRQIKSIWEVK